MSQTAPDREINQVNNRGSLQLHVINSATPTLKIPHTADRCQPRATSGNKFNIQMESPQPHSNIQSLYDRIESEIMTTPTTPLPEPLELNRTWNPLSIIQHHDQW